MSTQTSRQGLCQTQLPIWQDLNDWAMASVRFAASRGGCEAVKIYVHGKSIGMTRAKGQRQAKPREDASGQKGE